MTSERAPEAFAPLAVLRQPHHLSPDDATAMAPTIGPWGDTSTLAYSYSRVEERWEVVLRPDGSAKASVVVRRDQQISRDHRWRFVARRELPLAAARRSRVGLIAAGAAMLAAATALWATWTRPIEPAPVTLALPTAPRPRPIMIAPSSPDAPTHAIAPAAAPVRTPVPLIFPLEHPRTALPASEKARPSLAVADGPIDARSAVRGAIARAFASGEAEAWSDDSLSGFVVVGPTEVVASGVCRNTVILARGGEDGDRTISRRRCQKTDGAVIASDNP